MYALQVSAGVYSSIDPSCLLAGKGGWNLGTNYIACDVVEHGGSYYAAQQNHTGAGENVPPNTAYWTELFFMGPVPIIINREVPDGAIVYTDNGVNSTRAWLSDVDVGVWGAHGSTETSGRLGTENAAVEGNYGDTGPHGAIATQYSGVNGSYSETGPSASLGTETAGIYAAFDNTGPNVSLATQGGAVWGTYSSGSGGPFGGIGGESEGVNGSYRDSGPHGRLGTENAGVEAHYSYEGSLHASLARSDSAFYGENGSINVSLATATESITAYGDASIDGDFGVTGKLAVTGLPTSPPDSSGNAGVVCVTNDGNFWLDNDGMNDCE